MLYQGGERGREGGKGSKVIAVRIILSCFQIRILLAGVSDRMGIERHREDLVHHEVYLLLG